MTPMRLRMLALAIMSTIGAGNVWGQSALGTSDNALRAAYCIGVLDESIKELPPPMPPNCSRWAVYKAFKSEQDCREQLTAVLDEMRRDYEKKRQRYASYLSIQMPNLEHMKASIIAVERKGKADYQHRVEELHQCNKSCESQPNANRECTMSCVMRQDQNIIKCLAAPDELPF